jgi:aspartate-semialdehyde dehydrogenase
LAASYAILGAETLLGRELKEMLEARRPRPEVRLIDTSDEAGASSITRDEEGELEVMTPLASLTTTEQAQLVSAECVLLASASWNAQNFFRSSTQEKLDCTAALDEDPGAVVRAPLAEPAGFAPPEGFPCIAHPAAVMMALVLKRLSATLPLSESVWQIFEPATAQGQRALDELQQQTVSLLSFQNMKKDFYDMQAAFALLPRYGVEAPVPLVQSERRLERNLATLLARETPSAPMPSFRLLHAPVFHGYTASGWLRFARPMDVDLVVDALAGANIGLLNEDDEDPPNNVMVAGDSGIVVGAMERDRNNAHAIWLWAVADNLRLAAQNTMLVLEERVR